MMRFLRIAISGILLLGTSFITRLEAGSFSSKRTGTTTANFLKLGVGARAEAMGEAYSAFADDATAIYWNPAALTRIPEQTTSISLMHAPYLDPTYFDFIGVARNSGDRGAFAGGLQYFSGGSLAQTDITGTQVGTFNPYDLAASLSYAHLWGGFGWGLTGKYVRSQLLDSAQTFAMDVGIVSPEYAGDRLRLAFVATNLIGKMTFDQEAADLPRQLKLGSAFRINSAWNATLDLNFPNDNDPYAAVGSEYLWKISDRCTLAGRAGYNARTSGDIDGVNGITGGFGFKFPRYSIDYAMVPMGDLGLTQRISIGITLGSETQGNILKKSDAGQSPTSSFSDTFLDLVAENK